jgi:hypothetical protein
MPIVNRPVPALNGLAIGKRADSIASSEFRHASNMRN